ncbi:MAG: HAD family phosphatase [Verrucomicrobiota bacterium]
MNKPKTVVFDLGKVLLDFDYGIAAENLARRTQAGPAEVRRVLLDTPLLHRYENGEITTRDFFETFKRQTGYAGTQNDFNVFFGAIFHEIPAMVALQQTLRASGLPTFIFSNTNPLAIEHVREAFPWYANFDAYIYSYACQSMKPEPVMYAALEKLSGCKGADILYLDDRPENVAAGVARGWRGIVHQNPPETIAQVTALLG